MSDEFEKKNDIYQSLSGDDEYEQGIKEESETPETAVEGKTEAVEMAAEEAAAETAATKMNETTEYPPQGTTYSWVNPKLKNGQGTENAYGQHLNNPNTDTQYRTYQFGNVPPQQEKPQKSKKKKGHAGRFFGFVAKAAVFGLVAGIVFQGVDVAGNHLRGEEKKTAKEQTKPLIPTVMPGISDNDSISKENISRQDTNTVSEVARKAMPSVVAITNISVQETYDWFGRSQSYEVPSSGSGIIVGQNDSELLIATNNHVVEGATTLSVCFADESVKDAQIKGTDPKNDLAVIAVKLSDISAETQAQIKIAALGDSDKLELGEQVVAIGNALGIGQSVTSGYVSAVNRTIDESDTKLIQTDAAINPGNSGGALLNMKGELIGINSSKFADTKIEGIGFAIPLATAEPILENLMNLETRTKVEKENAAWLGITYNPISADVAKQVAEMYNFPEGVLIREVTKGGPADKAGIQAGDILTKFGGVSIASYETMIDRLQYYAKGESVEVEIARSDNGVYKTQTVTVKLGSRADMPETEQQTKE